MRVTLELLRKRAEHNDGQLLTLREIGLHQQGLEKIELIGQLCRRLQILYLQGNVICKIENLHRLKELEHLNLALNNVTKELHLLGNPCTSWQGYRAYVLALLPQLHSLDGKVVSASERISARQRLQQLSEDLRSELAQQGLDMDAECAVEDDSLADMDVIPETGHVDDRGEMVRPWCPATRLLDQRETDAENARAEAAKLAGMRGRAADSVNQAPPRRSDFPPLQEGNQVMQCNESKWDFELRERDDGSAVELEVAIGPGTDASQVKADVQPLLVRLLIKGRLLQLELPREVSPDSAAAVRSAASSRLVVTMPVAALPSGRSAPSNPVGRGPSESTLKNGRKAAQGVQSLGCSQQASLANVIPKLNAEVLALDADDDSIPDL
ncbi:hypothetical protein WJX73_009043 [Symbiochloris irregularis]|uniref:Dynein axonemal assembly factor 11-like CS domain-containing protein n=1 Tax=Symbiochloris irregularis TaxID=706552 RepID=A0AAW1PK23_9CHLO